MTGSCRARSRFSLPAMAVAVILTVAPAFSQTPPPGTLRRPAAAAAGPVVVPDRFLRRWDPVTIFFDHDLGSPGRAEDHPERYLSMNPPHPGAFQWVDARTLQFRPADPWPPLARFTWQVEGRSTELATLMAAPTSTVPAAGAEQLEEVQAITLVFPAPLASGALERMATIELRRLPGVDRHGARWLTHEDFVVKTVDRTAPGESAAYVLDLASPIPLGTSVTVDLRLSLDDDAARSFYRLDFATAQPFRVVAVGSQRTRLPVSPEGTAYTPEQAIDAGSDRRVVVVELSTPPQALDPVAARNLVRISPAVEGLEHSVAGRLLEVAGGFQWDTLYRVTLTPSPMRDRSGRPLEMAAPSEVYLYFPRPPAYLRWGASQGVVERFGPQMIPIEGRGHDRLDLRLYPVDPLDRSFWPFPDSTVILDESDRPPGPGEAPEPFDEQRHIYEHELRRHLAALGSPAVSELVELPLRRDGAAARLGLDLSEQLRRVAGPDSPGHYLVGLRALGAHSQRQWMRFQVTDLSLTTVEEPGGVRFVVTSLRSGRPVPGATVTVEGWCPNGSAGEWAVYVRGTTGADGGYLWPWSRPVRGCQLLRLRVTSGEDVLVLDPTRPPQAYDDGTWEESWGSWPETVCRDWVHDALLPENLSHIFTERPVYRPGEPVHIKGYVRSRQAGSLGELRLSHAFVVVTGPGDLEWREPVSLTAEGSFYLRFSEEEPPTGTYSAHLEAVLPDGESFYSREVDFRIEAYRLPRFEVDLHAPDRAPLDRDFSVDLTATYYAGGRVADRPVSWRVTQYPYRYQPADRPGFLFSSDARFSGAERFEATAAFEREDVTDADGSARLVLDPATEPTAQPRTYIVEATVTGADDQTVTATRRVLALPPFVLGLKLPRLIEQAAVIEPEIIVVGPDGDLEAGREVTVRLLHRQWHSVLRASDFSDGIARYITDQVDEQVWETTVTSGGEPVLVTLPIDHSGVYVVELEARDRVGRAQVVAADLYAGGDEPVTWARPTERTFNVSTDRDSYAPGDTATLLLQSPFQTARALVIIEAPDRNRYRWIEVYGGSGVAHLRLEHTWAPRLPVHLVLMRGRLAGTSPAPGNATDPGKPTTLATTVWLEVEARANRVEVELVHPERALPGQTVDIDIELSDPDGNPVAGEVTLWLVDQAVLALGREQRLDPLPDLILPRDAHALIHDTRDLPFGAIPFAENPGGGAGEPGAPLLDRVTVRRDFKTVPFYDPRILVGPDGRATATVELPDNLTVFKVRAKAASGLERFGFAASQIAVRLPVIVQPALPRFVRPGDAFVATAIGRVVEGEGGPGAAAIRTEGVVLDGPEHVDVTWVGDRPERLEFSLLVPTPAFTENGNLERTEVMLQVAVERLSDGATDAFEVHLPIRDDRRRRSARSMAELTPGVPLALPAVPESAREGSIRRQVLVSSQPGLIEMANGLDLLLEYPYGCTEQRLSRARAVLALSRFRDLLEATGGNRFADRTVRELLELLPAVLDNHDLVAYWPGSRGNVSLTSWVVDFLVEAREADYHVDPELMEGLLLALERALRSDYSRFVDGEAFAERSAALAALAHAGRFNPPYAAELARKVQYLDLESTAQVLSAFARSGEDVPEVTEHLLDELERGVVVRLHQGNEVYGGLQDSFSGRNGLILPSETRALAETARAVARVAPDSARLPVLLDGLVRLGRGDGWGSTNADAAALLALTELLESPSGGPEQRIAVSFGDPAQELVLGPENRLAHMVSLVAGAGEASLSAGPGPVVVRVTSSWIPAADGSQVAAESSGFVVEREHLLIAGGDAPPTRVAVDAPATELTLEVGQVVEDHVRVVNPAERHFVAVVVPLAAGMEPLNPNLATAPPEARPEGRLSVEPTYAAYLDDQVAFYYNTLPKGALDLYFRTRATVPGRYMQPPATAEMMYDAATRGNGNGAVVIVEKEQ